MQPTAKICMGLVFLAALAACQPRVEQLDEALLYQGENLQLKVVRYHEKLPFQGSGEIYRVLCASPATVNSPAHKTQPAGWVTLDGGAVGVDNAAELLERERSNYYVFDDKILIWITTGFNVSFDACRTRQAWYPTSLPNELITQVDKPLFCNDPIVNCDQLNFMGEHMPQFIIEEVSDSGTVIFFVRSKAFKNTATLRVRSRNYGETWEYKVL